MEQNTRDTIIIKVQLSEYYGSRLVLRKEKATGMFEAEAA